MKTAFRPRLDRAAMRIAGAWLAMWLAAASMGAVASETDEARAAAYFDRIADSPSRLRMFLQRMPKGADLHNHASGSVYAEDYLRWAADDGLCIAVEGDRIVTPPCDAPGRVPARGLADSDPARYGRVVDALSMRDFEEKGPGLLAREHFFAAFGGFRAVSEIHPGRTIAAVREAAAQDHVAYVETMLTPQVGRELLDAVRTVDGNPGFAALASQLAPLLPAVVARARADFDRYEAEAAQLLGCAASVSHPGCDVEVRYQVVAGRNRPPAQVFAMLMFGFALAQADPRWVGVNMAGPEHDPRSLRDYALHMDMLAFLKGRYPGVNLSLHAGELAAGMVPPRDLRFHVRDAVAVAGARRVGHGVDIAYETDPPALLKRMARDRIAVEIGLTSNAWVLGVKGRDHPLALYRAAGVPVVLSTDDQGVLRSDMTQEYMRAAQEHGLRYPDLKRIARNGLEYAFLPGSSLWQRQVGGASVAACAALSTSAGDACEKFLGANPKARLQWRLERDFAAFEKEHGED